MVLITPPLMTTVPPVSVVKLVKAVVLPTAPVNVVAPDVFTAKVCAPFSVLPNVMAPAFVLVNAVAALNVAASP